MSNEPHIADAESNFYVLNVTPDFCIVNGEVCPFDPMQYLTPERASYSNSVFARDKKVLLVDSLTAGIQGNAGNGIQSKVSLADGDVQMVTGSSNVIIENRMTVRHGDLCLMNVKLANSL